MNVTDDMVGYLARLARIACTKEEKERLLVDLQQVVTYFEQLSEIDTTDIEPLTYVTGDDSRTPVREDIVYTASTGQFLKQQAPQQIASMVKVPPVIIK